MDNITPSCPFCPFSDQDATFVTQHIEYCHPEGGSLPSFADDTPSSNNINPSPSPPTEESIEKYVDCPHGCGETVTIAELSTHLDLHIAEGLALDDYDTAQISFNQNPSSDIPTDIDEPQDYEVPRKYGKRGLYRDFTRGNTSKPAQPRNRSPVGKVGPDGAKRLGRSELGPHAHEKKMPPWLKKLLEKGSPTSKQTRITPDGRLARSTILENETDHLIPVIAKLCSADPSTSRVFLCSPRVRHICKLSREGGFCGYRNIQMLLSYIIKSKGVGSEIFPNGVPSILQLQELIEKAWDLGYNSSGRTETGGIKGTRKFIGTPEAQALFMSLKIPCDASSLSGTENVSAHDALYMEVASYFRSNIPLENETKVFTTDLPPIYFQHQGHSMTIIGFEIRENGSANILVFDPMFKTSPAMTRLIGSAAAAKTENPGKLLKAYRRETKYLQKYKMFELLKLSTSGPVEGDK